MAQFAPRIHVLLASDAPVGLVIRRGPSKSVATLLWNRRTDEFQLGQWLRGRIYERRSDLSPDGKHFLYFAMNGKWESESRGSWTAISRAPFLKALAFFPKGDRWHGGGLWTGPKKYWLNDRYGHSTLMNTGAVQRDTNWHPSANHGGECPGVYYPRLARDGWTMKEMVQLGKWKDKVIFEKECAAGWVLRKIAHAEVGAPPGKGCYWDEHELISSGASIPCPQWEWADVDGKRLVWAVQGELKAARLTAKGLSDEKTLFDFNDMTFAPIAAPY